MKGDITDIERATQLHENAVSLTGDYVNMNKPRLLSNLGVALQTRFDRLRNLIDLENAILSKQKAVDLTPDGHPDKFPALGICLERVSTGLEI